MRVDHDRWFRDQSGLHLVPAGKLPEEAGVDSRSAVEAERAPGPYDVVIGLKGRVVTSRFREARGAREARAVGVSRGDLLDMIERLEARVVAIEIERGSNPAEGGGE